MPSIREAGPENIVPTSSTTTQLALGDAIAISLLRAKGFTSEDFAKSHPGGKLGKKLTLMYFTEENNVLHFIYVLPFSHNKALVESTVFSKETFDSSWYREKINRYLKLKNIIEYEENATERGIIPMFFSEEKKSPYSNIFNIGIRGGACKPSTGYAFSFLIKQIQLLKNSKKNYVNIHKFLERKMDKIFINFLKNNSENGQSFIKLASNLNGDEFQSFMMGESNLLTKLKIIKSMPKLQFLKEVFK